MPEIHCSTCGNLAQPGERFCRHCGASLPLSEPAELPIGTSFRAMTTDELLGIWQANDRQRWSNKAIESVGDILRMRGVALPAQRPPLGGGTDETTHIESLIAEPDVPPSPLARLWRGFLAFWGLDSAFTAPDDTHQDLTGIDQRDDQVTNQYLPSEDSSSGSLLGFLFSSGGSHRRPHRPAYHPASRPAARGSAPRVHISLPRVRRPARPAPVHRSIVKGRHK